MASNQGHHVGSLPNDYAILARFAERGLVEDVGDSALEDDGEPSSDIGRADGHLTAKKPRRTSFPSSHLHPQVSVVAGKAAIREESASMPIVSETTPLLIPRIDEGDLEDDDDTKSFTKMFWEELRVLAKYTLPVFGCVRFV